MFGLCTYTSHVLDSLVRRLRKVRRYLIVRRVERRPENDESIVKVLSYYQVSMVSLSDVEVEFEEYNYDYDYAHVTIQ